MDSTTAKEEHEAMLNRKIEEIKKKNAELLRRHQLAEEDKRLAEEQGRSVTIKTQQTYSPMKGEILRAAEEEMERKVKQQPNSNKPNSKKVDKSKVEYSAGKDDGPPPDPSCKFLADKHREGPLSDAHKGKEFSRRHPRNFGGADFRDVPKKIHDEREKQTRQPQMKMTDFTVYTTGKERRELAEWRKEREKIDQERLERQKNKEGSWKREWDRDKDELSYAEQNETKSFSNHRQLQPVSRPVGRIGSGRFSMGHHKLSGLHKSFGRKDDKFKLSGKGKLHQLYKIVNDDSKNENLYDFADTNSKRLLFSPSSHGNTKVTRGTAGRQSRVVCEKNDSLIIKVKNEPVDLTKSSQMKTVTFAEPRLTDFIDPVRSERNFREVSKFRAEGSSDNSLDSSVKSSRKSYKKHQNYVDQKYLEDSSYNSHWPHGSSSLNKNYAKDDSIVSDMSTEKSRKNDKIEQTEEISSIENDIPQTPLKSSGKKEGSFGSGRINIRPAPRKHRNKHERKRQTMLKNKQTKLKTSEEVILSVETTDGEKTVTNDERRGKRSEKVDENSKAVSSGAAVKDQDTPPVHHSGDSEDDGKGSEQKIDKIEKNSSDVSVCAEAASVIHGRLDSSFDLDQDPPDGDQIDDEEWEDIDEEVCIDLINRGEEPFEDDVLDVSDENFEKFIGENAVPPRNHVDWAAEMESIEHHSSVDQRSVVKSQQQESQ